MESDGIITRTVYPEVPPRVEYRLSGLGESMRSILESSEAWGIYYQESVKTILSKLQAMKGRIFSACRGISRSLVLRSSLRPCRALTAGDALELAAVIGPGHSIEYENETLFEPVSRFCRPCKSFVLFS